MTTPLEDAKALVDKLEKAIESKKYWLECIVKMNEVELRKTMEDYLKKDMSSIETHVATEKVKLAELESSVLGKVEEKIKYTNLAAGLTVISIVALPLFIATWIYSNVSAALLSLVVLLFFGALVSLPAIALRVNDFWQRLVNKILP